MLKITVSQAIEGYLIDARARQLSPCTLNDYKNAFRHFQKYLDDKDPHIASITLRDVRAFFYHLSETPVTPEGCATRPPRKLSKKSVLNIHTALSALWTWALAEEIVNTHVFRAFRPPKPKKTAITPFTKDDLVALLHACHTTKTYSRTGKRSCSNTRTTAARDRAIVLILLDTGVRASELCADPRRDAPGALLCDYDERNGSLRVFGKGNKERLLIISPRTRKALWRYLLSRPDRRPTDNLITTKEGLPLTSSSLLRLIKRLGTRASVPDCHPHRFRHTFAITFLRNGGRTLELQQLLGHSTLDMVRHYARLAQIDLDKAMLRASPVDNWRL